MRKRKSRKLEVKKKKLLTPSDDKGTQRKKGNTTKVTKASKRKRGQCEKPTFAIVCRGFG